MEVGWFEGEGAGGVAGWGVVWADLGRGGHLVGSGREGGLVAGDGDCWGARARCLSEM